MCSLDFNPLALTPTGTPEVSTSPMTALLMIVKSWNSKKYCSEMYIVIMKVRLILSSRNDIL